MKPKCFIDAPSKPEAELTAAINRINDAVGRINSMAEYSRKINDSLYGVISKDNNKVSGNTETSCTLQSLSRVTEAVHDACTYLDSQLTRQQNLV